MDTSDELFHGSHTEIPEILPSNHGYIDFGGIFAALSSAAALSHGPVLHLVTSPRPLTDYDLNYEVEGAWEAALEIARGDEAIAEAIMDAECPVPDSVDDSDGTAGWELQAKRGRLAAKLGYTSVEMRDEHGTTWLCLPGCTIAVAR